MKITFWIKLVALAFVLALVGCNVVPTPTPIPDISLDATDTSASGQVRASAVVVPAKEARLSFVIPGLVQGVTVAEGDQVQAGQVLTSLDPSELEYDVIAAEAALTVAELEAQIQRQRRKRFNFYTFNFEYVSPPGEKILQADLRVEQRRFALEAAKASLAQSTLVAPVAGTVVEVNISPGEYVQPAQRVIVIADLKNLQIETTDLREKDVVSVQIDQPVSVYIEALGQEFSGKVTAISPISGTIGGEVVYQVTLKLDDQPKALLWGMSAEVKVNID